MITDPQNKIFSILKNTSSNLILQKGQAKLIYKTFSIRSQQAFAMLQSRARLNHPHLTKIFQVQVSQQLCGLAFQHYTQVLSDCIFQYEKNQNDHQIINTFQPILQAIDHVLQNIGHISKEFSLKNIVINQNLQVKYLDNFFFGEEIHASQQKKDQQKIFQKVALALYSLLFPKENSKTWKNRLKIARERSSLQLYNFLSSVFARSLNNNRSTTQNSQISVNFADPLYPHKIKKIKKTRQKRQNNFQQTSSNGSKDSNNKQSFKRCKNKSRFQKSSNQKYYSGSCQSHQGKQNKIYQ